MNLNSYKFKIRQISILIIPFLIAYQGNIFAAKTSVAPYGGIATISNMFTLQQVPTVKFDTNRVLANPQPGNQQLTLRAEKNQVQVYEEVQFFLEPVKQVIASPHEFVLNIGSRKYELDKNRPSVAHRFIKTGEYNVSVTVNVQTDDGVFVTPQIVLDSLIIQVDSVGLAVYPVRVETGESVNLRADFVSAGPNAQYRFFYGDGNSSDWGISAITTHRYSQDSLYQVFAEIRAIADNQVIFQTRSITRNVLVVSQPEPEIEDQILTLHADRTEVYTGEEIRFSVRPSEDELDIPYNVYFNFGDGTTDEKREGTDEITHRYQDEGDYTVTASTDLDPILVNQNMVRLIVDTTLAIQVDSVPLIINPYETKTGKDVAFEIEFRTGAPQIRYRFYFGNESSPSEWSDNPQTIYQYPDAGTYQVQAEIGRQTGDGVTPITSSVFRTVKISDSGIPWWFYVLAGLTAVAIYVMMYPPPISTPTTPPLSSPVVQLKPNMNLGKQNIERSQKSLVNYKIRFDPNVKQGDYVITTEKSDVIKNIRREK